MNFVECSALLRENDMSQMLFFYADGRSKSLHDLLSSIHPIINKMEMIYQ